MIKFGDQYDWFVFGEVDVLHQEVDFRVGFHYQRCCFQLQHFIFVEVFQWVDVYDYFIQILHVREVYFSLTLHMNRNTFISGLLKKSFSLAFLQLWSRNLFPNLGMMTIYNGFSIMWSLSENRTSIEKIRD